MFIHESLMVQSSNWEVSALPGVYVHQKDAANSQLDFKLEAWTVQTTAKPWGLSPEINPKMPRAHPVDLYF